MDLSKKELEEEVEAIKNCINAHEEQMQLHIKGVKVMTFNLQLFKAELEKFK